jgi:hypothetical protein
VCKREGWQACKQHFKRLKHMSIRRIEKGMSRHSFHVIDYIDREESLNHRIILINTEKSAE